MMAEGIPSYDELKLRLEKDAAGSYRVLAFAPDGRTGRGTFVPPLSDDELDDFVRGVGLARRTGRSRSQRLEKTKSFGAQLSASLLKDQVGEVYHAAREAARAKDRGLRITLYLTGAPELMRLPWEFLYRRPRFLSQSILTPIVRSLDLESARPPRKVELPLRILGLVSSPAGYDELDAGDERRKLEDAVGGLRDDGLLELHWLESATLSELERRIAEPDEIHVLHYIGHGAYDEATESGILVLEGARGRAHDVTGEELGAMLQDEESLRLVVLNSCEGARTSHVDPFSGAAASLVEFDIPAVIAMQFEITDEAAIVFSDRLYTAIAQGFPVDAAIAQARRAIVAAGKEMEFGTPVLFLRAADARLFDLDQPPVKPEPSPGLREADLALTLEEDPSEAKPGQQINWQLAVRNSGNCALREVTARRADGKPLADPVELAPGQGHIVHWTETLELESRPLITVTASDPRGSRVSEQISAKPVPAVFRPTTLVGARLLKVASESGRVALCDLKSGGTLRERWLPLAPEAASLDEAWEGHWWVEGGRLQIEVGKYWLDLRAEHSGLHFGVEQFGRHQERFAAVLVDPRFHLPAAEPWTALKLGAGKRGFRGSLICEQGGRLRQRHLFHGDRETRTGDWKESGGELIVREREWVLAAAQFHQVPGVWLGTERKGSAVARGFALARYVANPPG